MAMDATDGSSLDSMAELKKPAHFYGKHSSFSGSSIKDPNGFFSVFQGALGTRHAMKAEEEQEQFYEPTLEKKPELSHNSTLRHHQLHLPDLQDRLVISSVESTTKFEVNKQGRSPRRGSLAASTQSKKSPRDAPVITVESNAPNTRFWTHPTSSAENMTSTTSLLSLPQINRTTNGSKNAYARSCIDGPQNSNIRREEKPKMRTRSNSLIFPYRPSTFGKSLQARWCNGTGSRRRSSIHSKARSSWKTRLHERKLPHFTS